MARGYGSFSISYSKMKKHNEKLKRDVYNYLSDDEFYKLIKPKESTVNKYAKQRLREIERKRATPTSSVGCLSVFVLLLTLIIIVALILI
ncbi:MAG: hypothetical protein Q8920_01875 [Bacillota bacterium]|nr:hypothetical protein [Bacillota bacterium]